MRRSSTHDDVSSADHNGLLATGVPATDFRRSVSGLRKIRGRAAGPAEVGEWRAAA
jgi:hypothetical protein